VKNGESIEFKPFQAVYGGNVRKMLNMKVLGVAVLLGAGMILAGCKSAPDLPQDQALALIQAKYDQTAATGATVTLSKVGMGQGITDGFWKLTKVYPNRYWADYTLTDVGKKAVSVPGGGDVIQWRPESMEDKTYSVIVQTVAANHLKARDLQAVQDETVPGVATAKGADYTEGVDLTGVPGPLQDIAHNPGNQLSVKRHADFELDGGAWKLHSIE
jgi:hypothetical protein